jgi:hypothetical protein
MGYWRKRWKSRDGKVLVVDKYHSQKMQPKNPLVREKRRKRTAGASTLTQEQVNLRHRVDRLTRLLLDNFEVGDWWVTFKLADAVYEKTFRREYEKMLRRMRDAYRKAGHELKYIAVLENLSGRGRMHGHIIVNNVQPFSVLKKMMRAAWQLGDCHIKPYGGEVMDAQRLASYMCKEDVIGKAIRERKKLMTAARNGGKVDGRQLKKLDRIIVGERSRICPSTNLVRTKPKKEVVSRAETYREEIRAPRGYHVVKELSYSGWTVDGYPYQHAVYERDG